MFLVSRPGPGGTSVRPVGPGRHSGRSVARGGAARQAATEVTRPDPERVVVDGAVPAIVTGALWKAAQTREGTRRFSVGGGKKGI